MSDPVLEAREVELVGPKPLVLDGAVGLHVVESGSMGLFRAEFEGGEPKGPRRFLRRVGTGQPLLSTEETPTDGQRLLAVPIQRVVLREEPLAANWDGERRGADHASLVEEWVDLLTQMWSSPPEASLPVRVQRTRTVALDDEQDVAAERRTVMWVRVLEGRVDLLGDESCPLLPGEAPLPLGSGLWVRARGEARIEMFKTEDVAPFADLMAGVARLEGLVLAQQRLIDEQEEIEELARLGDRSRMQTQRVRGALTELVSVLEPIEEAAADGGPLLAAARVIGKSMGVEIRGPARSEDPARMGDPIDAIARASRLRSRPVRLSGNWWRRDCGPLLAWEILDSGGEEGEGEVRPVALLRRRGRYELFEPTEGLWRTVDADLAGRLESEAVLFHRPLPEGSLGLKDMARFAVQGRMRDLLMVLCVGVAATLLGMVVPMGTAVIMDNAIPDADLRLLLEIGLGLGAAVFGQAIFGLSERVVLLRVGIGSEAETQAALWDRLLRLRPSFFRRYSSGDLQSRVMAVNDVGREITGNVMTTLFSSLLALLNLGLLAYYSFDLSILAVAVASVVLVVTLAFGFRLRKTVRELLDVDGRFFGMEIQLIQAVGKLRVAGAEVRAFTHWMGTYTEQLRLLARALRLSDAAHVFNVLVTPISTVLLFIFSVKLLSGEGSGALSLGTFLAFNAAFGTFLSGVTSVSNTIVGFLDTAAKARRIEPILTEDPEVDQRKADPGRLAGQIAVERVEFRYREDGANILDDVSINAEPGEFIALVGPSGSGKSTLLRLLLGFETPNSGTITYDGQDLSTLDVLAVRRQLGVVLQNGRVATGSVFENIGSGSVITLDEAWAAAEDAGFGDDVREMPMGMHTIISEGGGNLSGGQRQRLLIARALATRPGMLFLDEATSALDNRTQAVVSESLERLRVTRIVVAHRLSTIRHADRIYVLEGGRIVEQGTFEELIEGEGLFTRMMARQLA